ncbi:MAG: hypothetical protein J0L99_04875 [Chitinophagales bacterium]|nr:hypothetical protein [Chitinophagales bacterium]
MTKRELFKALHSKLFPDWRPLYDLSSVAFLRQIEPGFSVKTGIVAVRGKNDQILLGGKFLAQGKVHAIEDILEIFFRKYNITTHLLTIRCETYRLNLDRDNMQIDHIEDLDQYLPDLRYRILDSLVPYICQFNTPEKVYERALELGPDKWATFLVLPLVPRLLIMKRLVNAPDFKDYGQWLLERIPGTDNEHLIRDLYHHLNQM